MKLLGLLLVLAALAGVVAFVPVGGRTVLDRWNDSRGAADFASKGWGEVAVATGLRDPPAKKSAARAARPAAKRPPPVERVTDADRAALDRLVSEHAEK